MPKSKDQIREVLHKPVLMEEKLLKKGSLLQRVEVQTFGKPQKFQRNLKLWANFTALSMLTEVNKLKKNHLGRIYRKHSV